MPQPILLVNPYLLAHTPSADTLKRCYRTYTALHSPSATPRQPDAVRACAQAMQHTIDEFVGSGPVPERAANANQLLLENLRLTDCRGFSQMVIEGVEHRMAQSDPWREPLRACVRRMAGAQETLESQRQILDGFRQFFCAMAPPHRASSQLFRHELDSAVDFMVDKQPILDIVSNLFRAELSSDELMLFLRRPNDHALKQAHQRLRDLGRTGQLLESITDLSDADVIAMSAQKQLEPSYQRLLTVTGVLTEQTRQVFCTTALNAWADNGAVFVFEALKHDIYDCFRDVDVRRHELWQQTQGAQALEDKLEALQARELPAWGAAAARSSERIVTRLLQDF